MYFMSLLKDEERDGPDAQTWDLLSATSMCKCSAFKVHPGLLGCYKNIFVKDEHRVYANLSHVLHITVLTLQSTGNTYDLATFQGFHPMSSQLNFLQIADRSFIPA